MIDDRFYARVVASALVLAVVGVSVFVWLGVWALARDSFPPRATITAAPPARAAAITTAGVLVVGREVQAGTYQTFAPRGCHWSVLAETKTGYKPDAARSGEGSGAAVVRISAQDAALVTVGCSPWVTLP